MTGEILTCAEMAKADAFAVAHGVPSLILMENAGRAVAEAVMARFKPCAVTVLCGPGNNGGDGFVAARLLDESGFTVRVAHDADHKGDAKEMSARWKGAREALTPAALDGAKLVVDGLFGAGLSRPLDGAYAQIVEALNDLPVVAIDMPSGVSGDTGQPLGGVYVKAALTVTFFRKKPGHVLLPGRALCGEVVVADIGIPAQAAAANLHENTPSLWHFPWPRLDGHKYTRGHCVVVSGSAHATGAGRLAARAALRAGAGLVSVASPPDAVAVNAAHLTAIMIKPFEGAAGLSELLSDNRLNTVVLGPGLGVGSKTHEMVVAALTSGAGASAKAGATKKGVVLDADAITVFEDDSEFLFRLLHDRCVLTPHAGEFERLFPGLLDQSASKLDAVRAAAKRAGCVVLLKGADTVIAAPLGKAAINANAPPSLATAGAGDVLAGFVAGLMAQGMAAFDAAACGTWLHGEAARLFGPGLIAEDLPEMLPQVLTALAANRA
ncbi:MAG TPA: NAD(P)H-hydrate dehydratase [Rhizomicrobium sp.]|nr:NAD(P)H-hydrate dehydratase [Rhizomicrobium sp.]